MKLIVIVLAVGCMVSLSFANDAIAPKFVKPPGRFNLPLQEESDTNNCGCHAILAKLKKVESNLLKLIVNLRNKHGSLYSELLDMKKHVKSVSWYVGQTSKTAHNINEQLLSSSISLAQIMQSIRDLTINQQRLITKTLLTESVLTLEKHYEPNKRPTPDGDIVYASCDDERITQTGTYLVQDAFGEPTKVVCVLDFQPGAYTVIQNRQGGSTDFYRGYSDYQSGFGVFDGGDYWLGLDRIHNITSSGDYELFILLEDFDKNVSFARYENFAIGSGNDFYPIIKLDGFSGPGGDSYGSIGTLFSAYDLDLDNSATNCAVSNRGAWWYTDCGQSNLNGLYLKGLSGGTTGMFWETFRGANYSLMKSRMMVRRKQEVITTEGSTTISGESTSMTTITAESTFTTSPAGQTIVMSTTPSFPSTATTANTAMTTMTSEASGATTMPTGGIPTTSVVSEATATTIVIPDSTFPTTIVSETMTTAMQAETTDMLDSSGSSGASNGIVVLDKLYCNYNCTIYLRGELINVSDLPAELVNLNCDIPSPGIPCCTKTCFPKN